MNIRSRILLSLLAAGTIALTGCGRTDASGGGAAAAPAAGGATASAAPAAAGPRVIELSADDTMKFNLTEIRAKAGETLRVTLTNKGRMPRQAMAHNWVLLKPMSDADVNAFGMSAATKVPDYLPADKASVVAHTKLLGGGETDSIEFTAPTAAGEYPFLCTFPGHFALMKGKLIVN